ncbi:MAG: PP2C family protein-serine/threonine phosphatase [Pseudonocardiaceae bacterium]
MNANLDGVDRSIPPPTRLQALLGDRLLLCSDGVSDFLAHAEISGLLNEPSPEMVAAQLVSMALAAGSRDNITAVLADIHPLKNPLAGWLDRLPAPIRPRRCPTGEDLPRCT